LLFPLVRSAREPKFYKLFSSFALLKFILRHYNEGETLFDGSLVLLGYSGAAAAALGDLDDDDDLADLDSESVANLGQGAVTGVGGLEVGDGEQGKKGIKVGRCRLTPG